MPADGGDAAHLAPGAGKILALAAKNATFTFDGGFHGGALERVAVGGTDVQLVRESAEYHFVHEMPAQPRSFVAVMAWGSEFAMAPTNAMVHAEVEARHFALELLGMPVAADGVPLPGFGFGSSTGGTQTHVEETEGVQDIQAVYAVKTTGVVVGTHDEGMTVVALPLA